MQQTPAVLKLHIFQGLQVWWAKGLPSSPKFVCWNPNPQCELRDGSTFGRWLGYESGVLVNKISDLEKEPQRALVSFSATWRGNENTAICNWEEASHQTQSIGTSILDFPASGTVKNTFLLFITYSIYGTLLAQPKLTKRKVPGKIFRQVSTWESLCLSFRHKRLATLWVEEQTWSAWDMPFCGWHSIFCQLVAQ